MTEKGEGNEGTSSSPLPLPLQPFFCFRSNFGAITRLETLATQATDRDFDRLIANKKRTGALHSPRGRRLKGKGKGVLGASPCVSLGPKTSFPFPFKRLPTRLRERGFGARAIREGRARTEEGRRLSGDCQ